ncbi:MAG: sigma-70 family RNA polymerase sigma factor [Chloroflexi bacterium]|nr:sigma-70 family RNA polymerase sigma factor [Chloroflexota bacterium]
MFDALNVDSNQQGARDVLKVAEPPPIVSDEATELQRFDALFTRFYPDLFGLVYRVLGDRMEVEDTLQETFLRLAGAPALQIRPDDEVGAWLRRVGLNLAFNRARAARRARERLQRVGRLEHPPNTVVPSDTGSASAQLERDEQRATVRRALVGVPERQRECLLLRYSGYSYAEIASTLGIARGSVGVLLARAESAFRVNYQKLERDQ